MPITPSRGQLRNSKVISSDLSETWPPAIQNLSNIIKYFQTNNMDWERRFRRDKASLETAI